MFQPLMIPQGTENKRFDTDFYVEGFATTFDKPYVMYEYGGIKYCEVIDRNALVGADLSDVIMQFDIPEWYSPETRWQRISRLPCFWNRRTAACLLPQI